MPIQAIANARAEREDRERRERAAREEAKRRVDAAAAEQKEREKKEAEAAAEKARATLTPNPLLSWVFTSLLAGTHPGPIWLQQCMQELGALNHRMLTLVLCGRAGPARQG